MKIINSDHVLDYLSKQLSVTQGGDALTEAVLKYRDSELYDLYIGAAAAKLHTEDVVNNYQSCEVNHDCVHICCLPIPCFPISMRQDSRRQLGTSLSGSRLEALYFRFGKEKPITYSAGE